MRYDPLHAPDPHAWLTASEDDRLAAVAAWHQQAGEHAPADRLHHAVHVVAENQLAAEETPVTNALDRLMAGGLDRHQAVHAIAAVAAEHMFAALKGDPASGPEVYYRKLGALTAEQWHARAPRRQR